jgi:hypothetical protein
MRNPWIDYKNYVFILIGFFLGMIVFDQDYTSPFLHNDVLTSSCSLGVVDIVNYLSMSLIIDCTL